MKDVIRRGRNSCRDPSVRQTRSKAAHWPILRKRNAPLLFLLIRTKGRWTPRSIVSFYERETKMISHLPNDTVQAPPPRFLRRKSGRLDLLEGGGTSLRCGNGKVFCSSSPHFQHTALPSSLFLPFLFIPVERT